jgi:hypothetical protein
MSMKAAMIMHNRLALVFTQSGHGSAVAGLPDPDAARTIAAAIRRQSTQ